MKEKYPKAWEKLRKYFTEDFKKLQQSIAKDLEKDGSTVEIPEMPEVSDSVLESILVFKQRALYDFFDENKVFISISSDEGVFKPKIYNHTAVTNRYESRPKAEAYIFEQAFEVLNKKL